MLRHREGQGYGPVVGEARDKRWDPAVQSFGDVLVVHEDQASEGTTQGLLRGAGHDGCSLMQRVLEHAAGGQSQDMCPIVVDPASNALDHVCDLPELVRKEHGGAAHG